MRPVQLDFARSARGRSWLGWTMLLIALGGAATLLLEHRNARVELARLEDRALVLAAATRSPAGGRDLASEADMARAVARQLSLPWEPLFQAVESAAAARVALVALQPDPARGVVRITGEARSLEEALTFVRRLSQARGLGEVHLDGHQVRPDHPRARVLFTAVAGVAPKEGS